MFFVYMMRTTGNTIYTGQTNDLKRRVEEHESKGWRASKYIKRFLGSKLVYYEIANTRSEAIKREHELKQLSHDQKAKLIEENPFDLSKFEPK